MNAMRWQMPLFVLLALQSTQLFGQQLSLFTQYREQATMLNPAALEQIGKQARALIQADFDAHSLARNLLEHFKKLLGHRLQVQ